MAKKRILNLIKKYKKILKKHSIRFEQVILFGSHAKNIANKKSDVDICVVFNKLPAKKFEAQAQLNGLAGVYQLPFDVILTSEKELRTNQISPILHEIREYGIKVK